MRAVQERPFMPQAIPENTRGITRAYGALIRIMLPLFAEIGFRLNNVLPKDGSEPMVGQLPLSDPTFDDYIVSGLELRLGASAPDLENLRDGLYALAFAGTGGVVEQGFFVIHIRHGFKPDAGAEPDLVGGGGAVGAQHVRVVM